MEQAGELSSPGIDPLPFFKIQQPPAEILRGFAVEPGEDKRLHKINPPLADFRFPDVRLRLAQAPRRLRLGQAGLFAGLPQAAKKFLITGVVGLHGELIDAS